MTEDDGDRSIDDGDDDDDANSPLRASPAVIVASIVGRRRCWCWTIEGHAAHAAVGFRSSLVLTFYATMAVSSANRGGVF